VRPEGTPDYLPRFTHFWFSMKVFCLYLVAALKTPAPFFFAKQSQPQAALRPTNLRGGVSRALRSFLQLAR
jgi:hypothetical protein